MLTMVSKLIMLIFDGSYTYEDSIQWQEEGNFR